MELSKKIFTGDLSQKEIDRYIKKIQGNKSKCRQVFYCITLPIGNDGILEIYDINELKKINAFKIDIVVVGLARSYEDATVYVSYIIDEIYKNDKSIDCCLYFS